MMLRGRNRLLTEEEVVPLMPSHARESPPQRNKRNVATGSSRNKASLKMGSNNIGLFDGSSQAKLQWAKSKMWKCCVVSGVAVLLLLVVVLVEIYLTFFILQPLHPDYSHISQLAMHGTYLQFLRDISASSAEKNYDSLPQDSSSSKPHHGGTRLAIGIGTPKSGTEYWFFKSQAMRQGIFAKEDPRYRIKRPEVAREELSYWNYCIRLTLTSNLYSVSFLYHVWQKLGVSSLYLKDTYDHNLVPEECNMDAYVRYGWGSVSDKLVVEKSARFYEPGGGIERYPEGVVLYEKTAQYVDNPSASYVFALYSAYINNLDNNRKYYPSGFMKYWIVLRNPIDRAYSNFFWNCKGCNATLVTHYIRSKMKQFAGKYEYWSTMMHHINELNQLQSLQKPSEADESARGESKKEKELNGKITAAFTNGVLKDFVQTIRRKVYHSDSNPIAWEIENKLKFGRSLDRSCYYPQVRMIYDFYYDSVKTWGGGAEGRQPLPIPMKVIQIDNTTNEYQSDLMKKFLCWIEDDCVNGESTKHPQEKIDVAKVETGLDGHSDSTTHYKTKEITPELRREMRDFFVPCNVALERFLSQHNELMFEGYGFRSWG